MSWRNILKQFNREHNLVELQKLENMFSSNNQKAIGYIPISWEEGIIDEIQDTASRLGLQYKRYEGKRAPTRSDGNSFSNGGHFMWNASKIEPYLQQTDFNTVEELIDFVAHSSYRSKPYRRIVDGLFGTPNIVLQIDRQERNE